MRDRFAYLFRRKSIPAILREASRHAESASSLRKELGVVDLTAFGIAAIIGAGIFSTIGNAAYHGGPAVIFLFVFTAVACSFAALCYAEFASRIPLSGSAYTYAYAAFGEVIAWIIGWDLLMEYAISNIAVAISWSDYFTSFVASYGVHVPQWLCMDFLSALRGYEHIAALQASGSDLASLPSDVTLRAAHAGFDAWISAPRVGPLRLVCDLPALLIIALVTILTFVGIRESKRASNIMVLIKVCVIVLVIAVGAAYVDTAHWVPFAPNGLNGVLKGTAGVFFAYIGFDAISTTAEECRNPQRDLPRGMILSLVICTVLYILVALVLTGMVSYRELAVGDPLSYVFGPSGVNQPWMSVIVGASAIIAMTTVLLVYQLGQPRIWMAMSRDGLLPPIFASIHPRFGTPWFSTLVTGLLVAVPALFLNLTEVTDLTSIGTLFAFALVCGGVLVLQQQERFGAVLEVPEAGFRIPYINGRCAVPVISLLAAFAVLSFRSEGSALALIPTHVFLLVCLAMSVLSWRFELSLIPVLGLLSCTYLITELGITNWLRFGIWLMAGLLLYFSYGSRHSKLASRM